MITVRKVKLIVNSEEAEEINRTYKFIRDSIYAQYQGLNRCMGYLLSGYYANGMDIKSDGFKNHMKTIKNSLNIFDDINFGIGIDSKSAITQKVKKDFSTSLKNGLAKGERGATNYKRNFPLMTRGRDVKISYLEDTNTFVIKWVNKIEFKVILGQKDNIELSHTLHNIINEEYKLGQCTFEFDKNNKLLLALNINIPDNLISKNKEIIPGRVLGVDLGVKVPAMICLNDNTFIKKSIDSYNEFFKVRSQFKARRERLYKQLESSNGGKGRKHKLKATIQFRDKEKNFARTYNHFLSKNIIEFAKKYKCETINLEELNKKGFDNNLLGKWGYYQLQSMIEYKAERVGIKVKYVDPAFTSQTCSKCGYVDEENRITQDKFECQKCGFTLNADHNAAINIARK